MSQHEDLNRADELCAQLIQFAWEGNITPMQWYQHLRFADGKPHLPAITILSDIAYWYRPVEVRDQYTGEVKGYRRKFKGHKLQRSYSYYQRLFGFTLKQCRTAVDFLEERGLVTREVIDVLELKDGTRLYNVLYLEINPGELRSITLLKVPPMSYRAEVCPTGHTSLPTGQTNTENSLLPIKEGKKGEPWGSGKGGSSSAYRGDIPLIDTGPTNSLFDFPDDFDDDPFADDGGVS